MSKYTETPLITIEEVRRYLRYDPITGFFFWVEPRGSRRKIGDRAGSVASDGYRCIWVAGKNYPEHVLAWMYMKGKRPKKLDHKNLKKDDNRIDNLREASLSQNMGNTAPRGKLGIKGVSRKNKHSFRASIKINGKNIYLGTYRDIKSAAEAYRMAAEKHYGEFAWHLQQNK